MKILVLQHKYDYPATHGYLLTKLCRHWVNQGHKIVLARGTNQTLPDADIAFLHVDLTKVSEEYSHVLDKYPATINGIVHDISKDLYSDLIVGKDDNFEGEVIIKTNANCGGKQEHRVNSLENNRQPFQAKSIPWSEVDYMPNYFILRSIADVPDDIWQNDNLIVEKFLPEQTEDGLFQLRIWIFLGEREIHYKSTSNAKIIKGGNTLKREILANEEVPEELRTIRKKLKFDYGKFDYAILNGNPILYDVNKTPGTPPAASKFGEDLLTRIQVLSQGLYDFIK